MVNCENLSKSVKILQAQSEPSSSDLMSLWIHQSVSIVSCETMLFCSSSDSLLTLCCGSFSASWHMVSLCFPCSVCGSGLSFGKNVFSLVCQAIVQLLCSLFPGILLWIPVCQPFGWPLMNFLHLLTLLDHFHDLEVALLLPLAVILFQYIYLTLLSLRISLLTGVMGLAPMCLVEFLPPSFLPPFFLLLQCLYLLKANTCISQGQLVGMFTVLRSHSVAPTL